MPLPLGPVRYRKTLPEPVPEEAVEAGLDGARGAGQQRLERVQVNEDGDWDKSTPQGVGAGEGRNRVPLPLQAGAERGLLLVSRQPMHPWWAREPFDGTSNFASSVKE